MVRQTILICCLLLSASLLASEAGAQSRIKLEDNKEKKQVDIYIDNALFTSYCYWDSLKKPVLFPLTASSGAVVTRGFPVTKAPGERVDHPHHISVWFNHGHVNGIDFWNNSEARPNKEKLGTIKHTSINNIKSTKGKGVLSVSMDWVMPDNSVVLKQQETIRFSGDKNIRIIDRFITLTAQDKDAVFGDDKDGGLAIRVARQLEEPSTEPLVFTDADGNPTTVKALDNTGIAGVYKNREGLTGEKEAWGKRSDWMTLSGNIKGEDVVIGIFDHPKNPNAPAHWHSRGYGLFAVNPFGSKIFNKDNPLQEWTLKPKQSATFKYRIVIYSGKLTKEQTEALYNKWLADSK